MDDARRDEASGAEIGSAYARFLRGLSHELRTPLGSILMLTELLEDGELAPIAVDKVRKIRQAAGDLRDIVEQVSTFAKAADGRLGVRFTAIDPASLVEDLRRDYSPRAHEKGLAFETDCAAGLPAALHTDQVILRQALGHLLDHALAATSEGRVMLSVANGSASGEIAWTVTDTGCGIPAGLRASVFEAFPAESFEIRRSYGASPLSLPLAKALSDLLDGRLTLESQAGRGTSVLLVVPGVHNDGHPSG